MICGSVKCTYPPELRCGHKKDHPQNSSCNDPCEWDCNNPYKQAHVKEEGSIRRAKCIPPIKEADKILNEEDI